jgi:hypothetical protein
MRRRVIATASVLLAVLAHWRFCEWRVVEYEVERADENEVRALWIVRRTLHPSGNAPAWDARQRELRAYHADWLACWAAEAAAQPTDSTAVACRSELDAVADATTRAVRLAACEAGHEPRLSSRPSFRTCLAQRGRTASPPPRWTRDDFGPRFTGPYLTLAALFAEDLAGSALRSRALGWALGIALPLGLVVAALALARGKEADS